jgi:outer membrane murein-binding lipoprotein Lpp
MMKLLIGIILSTLLLAGCASKDENLAYYRTIQVTNAARVDSRRMERVEYIKALQALKDSPVAVLALALTYRERGDAGNVSACEVKRPYGFVDGLKAASPILQTGLVWGLGAWGVNKIVENFGTRYTVNGNESYIGEGSAKSGGMGLSNSLEDCLANPPSGYNLAGDPLITPNMSCTSFYGN